MAGFGDRARSWGQYRSPWIAHPIRTWRSRHLSSSAGDGDDELPVPDELMGESAGATGLALLNRTALSREWIHRRVDEVTIEDRRVARRSVTLYFTMPADGELRRPDDGDTTLVPLGLVAKRKLTQFRICDEGGRTIPAYTHGARIQLCRLGLRHLAQAALEPDPVRDDVRTLLDDIVGDHLEGSRAAWRELERATIRRRRAGTLRNAKDDQLGRLGADDTFAGIALELATNVLLIAPVPASASKLRILRYNLLERYGFTDEAARGTVSARRWFGTVLRFVGWRGSRAYFAARGIVDAASFHMEIEAPPGLQIRDPKLIGSEHHPDGPEERVVDHALGSFRRAHLLGRPRPALTGGYAQVEFRLRSETVIRGACLNAVFATCALAGIGVNLSQFHPSAGATGLLLVVPSLMSLYVGQRLESPMSSRMAFGAKLLGTAPAVCAFAAAVTVVVASGHEWTGEIWWVLTAVSGLIAGTLLVALAMSRWRPDRTDVRHPNV